MSLKQNKEASVSKLINYLDKNSFQYSLFEHEESISSEDTKKVREQTGVNFSIEQSMKSLILKYNENDFLLLVVRGDSKYSNKKLKAILKTNNIRLASEEEVFEKTNGIKIGGVHPFGSIYKLDTYLDEGFLKNKVVISSAGSRTQSIYFNLKDYIDLEKPNILDFC